jgi:formylglycine-generating enzyme required for sulfatase activity
MLWGNLVGGRLALPDGCANEADLVSPVPFVKVHSPLPVRRSSIYKPVWQDAVPDAPEAGLGGIGNNRKTGHSMKKSFILTGILMAAGLMAVTAVARASAQEAPNHFVLVKGGRFKNTKSNYYGKEVTISDFYMDKYSVTQKEWMEVMGSNPSKFQGDDLPVEMVNWYDSVEYCNQRSLKEGLKPYYNIDKGKKDPNNKPDPRFGDLDETKWTVTVHAGANGYRLPTEAEWEYAAGGGQLSQSYTYSGSNDVDEVAWYWKNSGDKKLSGFWTWPALQQNHNQTRPVGGKKPNELGLYDMSGNVRAWCWDWYGDLESHASDPKGSMSGYDRVWKGGGWMGAEYCTESAFRGHLAANGAGPDQGLRLCRDK